MAPFFGGIPDADTVRVPAAQLEEMIVETMAHGWLEVLPQLPGWLKNKGS
jgi:hypothetical protein